MRKLLTITTACLLTLTFAACSGNTSAIGENDINHTPVSTASVLDLTGGWKQSNSSADTSYQIAIISNDTIEVYWQSEDTTALYWAGSYIPPVSETNEYSWDSINDKSRTDTALLASGDDTKRFMHKDDVISYSVSAMGVTTTVELERSDDVNIQAQQ